MIEIACDLIFIGKRTELLRSAGLLMSLFYLLGPIRLDMHLFFKHASFLIKFFSAIFTPIVLLLLWVLLWIE